MNCKKARHSMQLQQDGELPDRRRAGFIKHLNRCEACRRMQDQNAVIGGAFRELAGATSVRAAGTFLLEEAPRWERWRTPMAVAAMIVLVMGFWSIPLVASSAASHATSIFSAQGNHITAHPQGNADIPAPLAISIWINAGYWARVTLTLLILTGIYLFVRTGKPETHSNEKV